MRFQEDPSREGHTKAVAICGFGDSYKQAPFSDETVEIWGLNELHKYLPRWSRWFELHDADTLGVTKRDLSEGEQKRHLEWLSREHGDKAIYMQPSFVDRFPNAQAYPLDTMIETFGRYFTSTIGYMMALAIIEEFTWIGLFGVDLVSDVEYPHQRPNAEYLVGIARGLNRTVVIPTESAMCKGGHLYGYEKELGDEGGIVSAIRAHRANLGKKHNEALATINTIEGAMQECDNTLKLYEYKERGAHVETY